MGENRASIPAVYDSNRDPRGHFVRGNTASKNSRNEVMKRFGEIRNKWFELVTPEDLESWKAELGKCISQNTNLDVKLKAIVYAFDRSLGKPQDNVSIDINGEGNTTPLVHINLSPDELRMAEMLAAKLSGQGEQPEALVIDVPTLKPAE